MCYVQIASIRQMQTSNVIWGRWKAIQKIWNLTRDAMVRVFKKMCLKKLQKQKQKKKNKKTPPPKNNTNKQKKNHHPKINWYDPCSVLCSEYKNGVVCSCCSAERSKPVWYQLVFWTSFGWDALKGHFFTSFLCNKFLCIFLCYQAFWKLR